VPSALALLFGLPLCMVSPADQQCLDGRQSRRCIGSFTAVASHLRPTDWLVDDSVVQLELYANDRPERIRCARSDSPSSSPSPFGKWALALSMSRVDQLTMIVRTRIAKLVDLLSTTSFALPSEKTAAASLMRHAALCRWNDMHALRETPKEWRHGVIVVLSLFGHFDMLNECLKAWDVRRSVTATGLIVGISAWLPGSLLSASSISIVFRWFDVFSSNFDDRLLTYALTPPTACSLLLGAPVRHTLQTGANDFAAPLTFVATAVTRAAKLNGLTTAVRNELAEAVCTVVLTRATNINAFDLPVAHTTTLESLCAFDRAGLPVREVISPLVVRLLTSGAASRPSGASRADNDDDFVPEVEDDLEGRLIPADVPVLAALSALCFLLLGHRRWRAATHAVLRGDTTPILVPRRVLSSMQLVVTRTVKEWPLLAACKAPGRFGLAVGSLLLSLRATDDPRIGVVSDGEDRSLASHFKMTPLTMAVAEGNVALVLRLLSSGADPNLAMANGSTPLITSPRPVSYAMS
jgi:hypothetical protein